MSIHKTMLLAIARPLLAAATMWLASFSFDGAAQAQDNLVLREQIKVFGDLVTLGDLFENAGATSGAAIFRSPDLGSTGVVSAQRVAAAAQQHGAEWRNPGGIAEIVVRRPGRQIALDEIRKIIAEHAAGDDETWSVTFSRGATPFHVDPRVTGPAMVKHFDLQQGNGRFRAVVSVANAGFPVQDKIYTGQAYPSVAAIVPARAIERGATIVPEDLTTVRLPRSRVSNAAIEQAETAIGMAAKQRLIAGRPIRRGDLEPPRLVERNGVVTIVYKSPGMVLKTKGRALADATLGQSVAIVNVQSKRTIEAEVTGAGLVSVSAQQSPRPAQPKRTVQQSNRGGGKNLHVIR